MNVRHNKLNVIVLHGAFILTLAAVITKILSAVYRVPFQNIVGDIGFYIYQQVYPFYGIAIILSTTGFPVMISKLVHDTDENHQQYVYKVLKITSFYLLVTSFLAFLLLYFGSSTIATWMGDRNLTVLLKVISLAFLTLPFVSILRGYFQSQHVMQPTAISQVVEQTIRVVTILVVSYLFVTNGFDLYLTGAGAIFGSLLGSIGAFFVLFAYWQKGNSIKKMNVSVSKEEVRVLLKRLIIYSVTICMTSMLLIFIQMVDSFNLYSLLVANGLSENEAKIAKGIYDRGQPLLQLGTIVATSLALSLVPAMVQAMKRSRNNVQKYIDLTYKVCFSLAIAATAGIVAIMEPLNVMLFSDSNGSNVLAIYCLSILFSSIAIVTSGILQGLDRATLPALTVLAGVIVKWIFNTSLIPFFGTMGAAVATVIAYLVVAFLNMYLIWKQKFLILPYRSMVKIVFIAFGMFFLIQLYQYIFFYSVHGDERIISTIQVLTSVAIGATTYLLTLYQSNVFHKEEWAFLLSKKTIKK
ncbi:polysaccharide biosynthesis protein [Bacillus sp. FJAT-47783]|uniref:putative polysaccharide biosynthesis protein n=1 Tax=Bacillus sp. FJAT-47783 TaxID=2922712 RepID=UPI001FAD915C|nr:polysaccharide biosynthesis protein [Bacillus sp. FJAT-47783]